VKLTYQQLRGVIMTELTFTPPTADEQTAILKEHGHGNGSHNYPPPAEGYVRATTVAKTLNEALVEAGAGTHVIPSQMVYNYLRKGYIKTDQYPHVPEAEAMKFITVQFTRRVNRDS
jgi:hypothetical protein